MGTLHWMFIAAATACGIVTGILIVILFYRSTLVNREEDQPHLDPAERLLSNEQHALVARIERLTRPIRTLFVLWGIFLLAALALWLWEGLNF
jgi:hypothetical protein